LTIDSRYSHSRHAVCPNSRQCRFSSHRDSRPASSTPRCAFETDTISDAAGQTQPSLVRDVPAASDQTLRYIDDDGVFPGLHAVTNCNAFGVTHRESGAADTRLLALLQNASFLPLNRDEARSRGGMDGGESVADLVAQGSGSLEEVSATMSDDPVAAARQTLAWLQAGGEPAELAAFLLATAATRAPEEHDWKYPVAVIEELEEVSDGVLPIMCAASVLYGTSSGDSNWSEYETALAAISAVFV